MQKVTDIVLEKTSHPSLCHQISNHTMIRLGSIEALTVGNVHAWWVLVGLLIALEKGACPDKVVLCGSE